MKRTRKIHNLCWGLGILIFLAISHSGSAEISIQPLVIVGWEYNSNYFRSEVDEVAVDTYYIKPGVRLNYDSGKSKIKSSFLLEPYWFNDRDSPPPGVRDASDDDFVGFRGKIAADTKLTDRVTLGLDDTIFKTRDPARSDVFSDSIERDKYIINRLSPYILYDFGERFDGELRYTNTLTDFSDDIEEDSLENKGYISLFYNFSRRSAAFLSYGIWERDYDGDSSTYLSNQVKLNFKRQFNRFFLTAGGGYHHRSFDDDDALDDLDLFSWKIMIDGQEPPAPESSPRAWMQLAIGQNFNNSGRNDEYFVATRVDAQIGYVFMEKITTEIKGYYQNSDYENDPANRDDDTYSVSGLIGYNFWKKTTLAVEVGHTTRESNIAGRDYDDTFAAVTLDMRFDPFGK